MLCIENYEKIFFLLISYSEVSRTAVSLHIY